MERLDYQTSFYNPIIKETCKGFLIEDNELKSLKENAMMASVPKGMEYRPDLIAEVYFGDPTMAWLISYVNNFTNGVRDYTLGRAIKIPQIQ